MNIENFFNEIKKRNWQSNTQPEALHLYDELIEHLSFYKNEIVSQTLKDISILREMKLEEGQEYTYEMFKQWLLDRLTENIIERLNEK